MFKVNLVSAFFKLCGPKSYACGFKVDFFNGVTMYNYITLINLPIPWTLNIKFTFNLNMLLDQ